MILILGETVAAREINLELSRLKNDTIRVETRTELANLMNKEGELIKQLNLSAIPEWLANVPCSGIVDASHPSSSTSFLSLRLWSEKVGIPFLRLERAETKIPENSLVQPAQSWDEAMLTLEKLVYLKRDSGRSPVTVFVTTGSHQLENLVQRSFVKYTRLVIRVLPEGRLIQKCQDLGIPARDIIAMQGPFSKELNRILFKTYRADILLTRDSGPAGGTDTKISAALALGLQSVLIKRPTTVTNITGSQVHSVKEVIAWVKKLMI